MRRPHYSWRPLRDGEPWTLEIWTYRVGGLILAYLVVLVLVGWLSGWTMP